jgi:hypothetical protein
MIGSMFLNWIDLGGVWTRSGFRLAWSDNHWLFLVPIAGGLLLAAAASRSPNTRLAAVLAGLVVAGYTLFNLAHSLVHAGFDTWLILGGAGVMLAGATASGAVWRAVGGVLVLAGFAAPWVDFSMFRMLRFDIGNNGIANVLWLIPVAGVLGIISAGNKQSGAKLAGAAGVTVYASLLVAIGYVAWSLFGLGAWIALGASATALVIGVLSRGRGSDAPVKA